MPYITRTFLYIETMMPPLWNRFQLILFFKEEKMNWKSKHGLSTLRDLQLIISFIFWGEKAFFHLSLTLILLTKRIYKEMDSYNKFKRQSYERHLVWKQRKLVLKSSIVGYFILDHNKQDYQKWSNTPLKN